jgi:exosortase
MSSSDGARPPGLIDLLTAAAGDPARRPGLVGAAVCLALFAWMFRDSLAHFFYAWTRDENYSHGFLVPLISLYFANLSAAKGPVPLKGGIAPGLALLGAALLIRMITVPLPIPFLADLALLLGLAGMSAVLFGAGALRRYWFAFFFLIFMIPLPVALYSRIASPLQLLASQAASLVMNASGVPVLREGNKLTLPGDVEMFVAEACSGMRQLTGFIALTAAVAFLTSRPPWYRILIMISAIPIALTANIARVVLTGYIMHFVNPMYASGPFHTLEGLLMMGFGLLLLNLECWALDGARRLVEPPGVGPAEEAQGQ